MAHSIYWFIVLGADILLAVILLILLILLVIQLLRKPSSSDDEESCSQTTASLQPSTQRSQEPLIIDLTQRSGTNPIQQQPPLTALPSDPTSNSTEEEIEILPDEPPMDPKKDWIDFEPKTLGFAGGVTAMQKIGMTNTTNRRLAVKVLCSNNRVYRVEPVYSFVEPKQTFAAEVHRFDDGRPPKEERLVFAIIEAAPTDSNIREIFKGTIPKEVEFKILVDGTQILVTK